MTMPFAGFRAAEVDEHAGPVRADGDAVGCGLAVFAESPCSFRCRPSWPCGCARSRAFAAGLAKSLHSADGASAASHRASALPGSAISSTEPYHQASQPASGRPVNTIRFSG